MNRFEAGPLPFETFIESHAIMKKLPFTKTESCPKPPAKSANPSGACPKESFKKPSSAVAPTPVGFERVTLEKHKLHLSENPQLTPTPGAPAGQGCHTDPNPRALFHPQPWVWAKRLMLFYWAQTPEAQTRWPSLHAIATELRCTRAGICKDFATVRILSGLKWAGGKSERSKRAFKIAQQRALARGTHSSFRRREKKLAMGQTQPGQGRGGEIDIVQ